jgi:hypothetical protein
VPAGAHTTGVWDLRPGDGRQAGGGGEPPGGSTGVGLGALPDGEPFEADPGVDVAGPELERYASVRARPVALLAARTALWAAVGVGFLGGVLGLTGWSSAGGGPRVAPPAPPGVPAAVAGTAELAAASWLTASSDDEARLAELFVEQPSIEREPDEVVTVGQVVAVAGHEIGPGYWAVTVAAQVTEPPAPGGATAPDDGTGAPGGGPGAGSPDGSLDDIGSEGQGESRDGTPGEGDALPPMVSTWYLELGIVGDVEGGLAALAGPAVLPAPPPLPEGWAVERAGSAADADDPVAVTVDGFLQALLTGSSDAARYLAPGVEVPTSSSPPFAEVEVDGVYVTVVDDVTSRAHVWLTASTPGGSEHRVRYEVTTVLRADRWEVVSLTGAPAARRDAEQP